MKKSATKKFIIRAFRRIKKTIVLIIYDLSALSIRDKNMIVFGSQNGTDIGDNPKFLYNEIKKRAIYRLIWILKDKENVRKNQSLGYECYYHKSLKGIYYQLKAKYFIHSHSINNDFANMFLGGATSILTWHGVGLKKAWGANKRTYSYKAVHEKNPIKRYVKLGFCKVNQARHNYVISTSPRVSSYYPETFLTKEENVIELGQARNDIFFKEDEISNAYLDFMRDNRVILYMPTHRNKGKSDSGVEEVLDFERLEAFCEKYNYKFVIKAHIYSHISLDENYDNIIDASEWNIDAQLLLKYADVLITDYSSCYTDYLMLDRPVIFYCYDYNKYIRKDREMYFEYDDVTPGEKVRSFENLMTVLNFTAVGGDFFKAERKRVLDIFYSPENQGRVTEKQVDYILTNIIKR
ncbi:CDP-glycerol glycerophosphotransferase family protein [Clostridium oryzae]|uniref:CDP-glycerol:poly(Glycerophosphate) glycerophosphotransferase n=1 Tax=Clostridium oryzae TaxID=1450648 RepID=A0A1V4J069_9CLOT|nr:CDP-glycerol glycerophosphotransferase family protein [Clostridium oryzae]OPJ65057.1 CDP-glycerol:poly(glycerophosphate) glycerophosphotransferase [Clostridium oryzae]